MNLNDIKNIDTKKIKYFLTIVGKNYDKDAIIFTIVFFLITFFGIKQFIIPSYTEVNENVARMNQKKQELDVFVKQEKYASIPKSKQKKQRFDVEIYQAPFAGMDAESAAAGLVEEIIRMIKKTGNNRINYVNFATSTLDKENDSSSKDYSVLTLSMSIEGSYQSIQSMLNEIYFMKHLVSIKNIESRPLSNPNIINTDLVLDVYVNLDGLTK